MRRRLLPRPQPRRQTLRLALEQELAIAAEQHLPATEQLLDARAQCRPVRLRHGEMPPQVEQRHLADLATQALGAYQPMREVTLAGGGVARLGTTEYIPETLDPAPRTAESSCQLAYFSVRNCDSRRRMRLVATARQDFASTSSSISACEPAFGPIYKPR